jgi:phosphotransferase system HPr (HPr) family protein
MEEISEAKASLPRNVQKIRRRYQLCNEKGLHARAATQFVRTASQFDSAISVYRDEAKADGKSVMSLLILAVPCGSAVDVEAEGTDAENAVSSLGKLIESGFGE